MDTYRSTDKTGGHSLTSSQLAEALSEDNTRQNLGKGYLNTETSSPYISWSNSPLEKISRVSKPELLNHKATS